MIELRKEVVFESDDLVIIQTFFLFSNERNWSTSGISNNCLFLLFNSSKAFTNDRLNCLCLSMKLNIVTC